MNQHHYPTFPPAAAAGQFAPANGSGQGKSAAAGDCRPAAAATAEGGAGTTEEVAAVAVLGYN